MSRKLTLRDALEFCENMKAGGWNNIDIADRFAAEVGHTVSRQSSEDRTMTVFTFDEGILLLTSYGEIDHYYTRKEENENG